ncbi:MAG: RNA ligase family protein [Nanoarchaeota archaeon]
MTFVKYPKIKRLDDKENQNLLNEKDLIITEKLDGSNLCIWKENQKIKIAKRTSEIEFTDKQFMPFCSWVKKQKWEFLEDNIYIYGECLIGKETQTGKITPIGRITYKNLEYFVIFDIFDGNSKRWLKPNSKEWNEIFKKFKETNNSQLNQVPILEENISINNEEELNKHLKKSNWCKDSNIEGIVIKKYFENGKIQFAKLVTKEFKEVIKRKPNPKGNKIEEIAKSVITKARIEKICKKENINCEKDFGKLIKETIKDVFDEEESYLQELSWKLFKKEFGSILPKIIKETYKESKV